MLAKIARPVAGENSFSTSLRNQTFRRTLLMHDGATLTRKVSPERISGLRIATKAQPVSASPSEDLQVQETFRAPAGGTLDDGPTADQGRHAGLVQRSPATIDFDELCALTHARLGTDDAAKEDERNALAFDLLQSFGAGVVRAALAAVGVRHRRGPRPEASAVARLQAGRSAEVTNLRHEWITLDDEARRCSLC